MKKLIMKLPDIVGKTILGVHHTTNSGLALVFDDSFIILEADKGYYGEINGIEPVKYDVAEWHHESVQIGVATVEEVAPLVAQRQAHDQAIRDQRDRAEFERLQRKFQK